MRGIREKGRERRGIMCVYVDNKDTETPNGRRDKWESAALKIPREWARGEGRSDGGHVLPTSVYCV